MVQLQHKHTDNRSENANYYQYKYADLSLCVIAKYKSGECTQRPKSFT